jgi:hypothetical protein
MNEEADIGRRNRSSWKRPFSNPYVILFFRYLVGATFLLSSFGKLVNIREYSVARVYNYQILPNSIAIAFGWALPFIELLCALGLICGVLTRLSALGFATLSASFFLVKAVLLMRGVDFDCGCFGAVVSTVASVSIYMDPFLLLMSVAVLSAPEATRDRLSFGRKLPHQWRNKLRFIW